MPPSWFEPTIPASEQPQTDASDRVVTGISSNETNRYRYMKHTGQSRNIHFSQKKKFILLVPFSRTKQSLKMGPSSCPETSVAGYQHSPPNIPLSSGVPRGGWGVQTPLPPRNSEDIGGVLDCMSKKDRRLDFLLQFTVFLYGCNLLNKGFF